MQQGGTLTATATIAYDDQASNPFLHTYHPDHDNLDAFFQNEQPIGYESYQIMRQFTLVISPPGSDFASMTTSQPVGFRRLSGGDHHHRHRGPDPKL